MKKKVFLYLSGGIGNQLFQYAAGFYIANIHGAELLFEPNLGFYFDKKYRRKFLLGTAFNLSHKNTNFIDTLIFIGYLAKRKIFNVINIRTNSFFGIYFVVENDINCDINIILDKNSSSYWLVGYWQRQLRFVEHHGILVNKLQIIRPKSKKLIELGSRMMATESVALGIRLYEETDDPRDQMVSDIKSQISRINLAILNLIEEYPDAKFYIFCTHYSELMKLLVLPEDSIYLLGDRGYEDPVSTLWLLSQCRHHIFTSSSFYWWGAWLSMSNYDTSNIIQKIIMINTNNYLDVKQENWLTF